MRGAITAPPTAQAKFRRLKTDCRRLRELSNWRVPARSGHCGGAPTVTVLATEGSKARPGRPWLSVATCSHPWQYAAPKTCPAAELTDFARETLLNFDSSMWFSDLAIIFATLVGPILAVWAAEWRQARKADRDRMEWVFRTLMSTRGEKLRQDHVSAINHIEFAFTKQKCPAIDDARALYRKHLRHKDSLAEDQAVRQAWANKANDLFADLLYLMALELKIPFTKTEITEESYRPDAHFFNELEWEQIRHLLLQVLKNGRPINFRPIIDTAPSNPPSPPAA